MTVAAQAHLDEQAVSRAASALRLSLPRGPHRGKVGEVRAASAGASMEIHDFRQYAPGDDLRQLDWNAVARTGEWVLRVRQEEVSPRVEVVLDASRSMAVTARKAARARELALLCMRVAARQGLEPVLVIAGARGERVTHEGAGPSLRACGFDGQDALAESLRRAPPLRRCGLRLVVSDGLFEADLGRLCERLAREASGLQFLQLLDPEDLAPLGGHGARLVDAESGQALERILSNDVLRAYGRRLDAHQALLRAAVARVHGALHTASAALEVADLVRGPLSPLFAHGGMGRAHG